MHPIKKLMLWLIVLIIILIGALFITLQFVITPERFKPIIGEQIEKLTGYQVSFNGPLGWEYLPHIAVNANNIILTSPNKDQVSIKQLSFGVKLLPLLHKQLELTHINIDDINYQNNNGASTELRNLNINAKPFAIGQIFRLRISGEIIQNTNPKHISTINISAATLINQETNSIDLDPITIILNNNIAKGDFHFNHDESATPNPNATMPNSINFNGNFKAEQWQIGKMTLNNLRLKFNAKNSVVTINPFLTDFYQGKARGKASINLQEKSPSFRLSTNLDGSNLGDFLNAVTGKDYATGTVVANIDLQGQGTTTNEILKALNGSVDSTVTNGQLKFANINKTISTALLVVGQENKANQKTLSLFNNLNAQAKIKNGLAKLNLNLLAPTFNATGTGEIDLLKQTIDLLIKAYYTHSDSTKNIAIPIKISGKLSSPDVKVDASSALINSVVNTSSKELKDIKNSLKKFFN